MDSDNATRWAKTPPDQRAYPPTGQSRIGRLALVAALTGFGFLALAVNNITPPDQHRVAESPAAQGAPAIEDVDYFPSRLTIDPNANDSGVVKYEYR